MSTELGAISSYALSMQRAQIAVIKANNEMQKLVVEMLSESIDNAKSVPSSSIKGVNVDFSA